ncbi:hypothetical protein [Phytohabitans rumicis]|uniref:Uncharacterized protein n=1 Tax=Phytohabitans rumicis TaxID=1076125 RepID=A0A6V8LCC8_9ACTN|nr:hypothetical protein [Phytohabitans rumicis]GFJ92421.1 hypothetical protein Prum_060630 [Phytohabitans rumicis]
MAEPDDALILPVPEAVSATYLVPTSTPPDDPSTLADVAARALDGLVTGTARDLARQMLAGPLMTIDTREVADLPALPLDLLSAFGASDEQVNRVGDATHVITVGAGFRPGWPPAHEWSARAVAAALGHTLGADLIDGFQTQVLTVDAALRSLPDAEGRVRLTDWILIPYSPGDTVADGMWFTTKGLGRFGLLELQTHEVPPHLTRGWGATLTGVARRLLRTWSDALDGPGEPAFLPFPATVTVTGHDIAMAYGAPAERGSDRAAELSLALDPSTNPDADSFLTVAPPEYYRGPASDYYTRVCATLFAEPVR